MGHLGNGAGKEKRRVMPIVEMSLEVIKQLELKPITWLRKEDCFVIGVDVD